jgi:hypothetical protein
VKLQQTIEHNIFWGVSETRALRGIFTPKRQEITRQWRKCHNEEIQNLSSLTNTDKSDQTKEEEMGRTCSMDEKD